MSISLITARTPAALLSVGAAVTFAAVAAAQPPPPPPPPPGPSVPVIGAPLGPAGLGVLGQTGTPSAGPLGQPAIPGIDENTVLGQHAVPSAPGAGPGAPPDLRAFNNAYGVPQYETPAAPGEGRQFGVAPGHENDNVNGREWLGRYFDLYHDGQLKGALLGQSPQSQLGLPLPGTAPPEGTNLPPGMVQYLPPPPLPGLPQVPPPVG